MIDSRADSQNDPATVIAYVNAAHFIDHYAMLVFAAAVVVMAPAMGAGYADLLPLATPGFVAFGAGSLLTGWLGDRWSRRHMMAIFFAGIGASLAAVGLARTPLELGAALFAVGAFASIYHPVGTAMLVASAGRLGREIGINGVWGNLGVASSALVTGVLAQALGWRWAFIVPGLAIMALAVPFMRAVAHEAPRTGVAAGGARIGRDAMARVVVSLLLTVVASSTTFNAVTVALPKLFAERLAGLVTAPALLGLVTAGVYVFGAATQYIVGGMIDRMSLKRVFLPLALAPAPLLAVAAQATDLALLLTAVGLVMAIFGQVTVNDAMVGKYTSDAWRSRAFSVRYFVGFTAAGASVGLVSWFYSHGGFAAAFQALAALNVLVIAGALVFPSDRPATTTAAVAAE